MIDSGKGIESIHVVELDRYSNTGVVDHDRGSMHLIMHDLVLETRTTFPCQLYA